MGGCERDSRGCYSDQCDYRSPLVYRQYLKLASESMEFAALVISLIEEAEDGTIPVNPLSLAATSMDHISQLSGLLKWVRL
ncbi:hypothetical protein [Methanospirillum sp.]|uniref:hypothetical protein n=1 Tax=Methanospirillum sp. TaxID=45200 RepID=UPI002624DD75|nr:hypothetical protein [Methanospirillum sp.]